MLEIKSIDLENSLFYGIHYHQEWLKETRNPKEEAKILQKILETGFIASKRNLQKILTEEEYENVEKYGYMDWNKLDYVSVTFSLKMTSIYEAEIVKKMPELSDRSKDYDNFIYHFYKKFPTIVLDLKLLEELQIRPLPYNKCIGEIQIKDKIPTSYFKGIMLPNILTCKKIEEIVTSEDLLDKSLTLIKENFLEWSEEEFMEKYYEEVILFENVLKFTHSSLKLFHTETGEPILSLEEILNRLRNLKNALHNRGFHL